MVVVSSDHHIPDSVAYRATIEDAISLARQEHALVTIGVVPRYPETGYGYIEGKEEISYPGKTKGMKVSRFLEKPPLTVAEVLYTRGWSLVSEPLCLHRVHGEDSHLAELALTICPSACHGSQVPPAPQLDGSCSGPLGVLAAGRLCPKGMVCPLPCQSGDGPAPGPAGDRSLGPQFRGRPSWCAQCPAGVGMDPPQGPQVTGA